MTLPNQNVDYDAQIPDEPTPLAPVPPDEAARLAALACYRLEHAPTPPALQSIVAFAAEMFQAPISMVSLIGHRRVFFSGQVGMDLQESSRDVSFCAHAMMNDTAFVVPDATQDPRFAENPFVVGEEGIRFYAGAPLINPQGHRLGALCVVDRTPRPPLTTHKQGLLANLAQLVMDHMERQRLEAENQATQQRFRSMVLATPSAVMFADPNRGITFWNRAAELLFDCPAAQAVGQQLDRILPGHAHPAFHQHLTQLLANCGRDPNSGLTIDAPVSRFDGTQFEAEITLAVWPEDGQPVIGVAIRDISVRKKAQADLRHIAYHDLLTGLFNRVHFAEVATMILADRAPAGLVLLDLDGFKHVNDTLGHGVGDILLQQVAQRLKLSLNERGALARLGGDEFAVILPGVNSVAEAAALTRQLQASLSELPFLLGARRFVIKATAGIAIAPTQGDTLDALLSNADLALYQGKAAGAGTCQIFDASMRAAYNAKRNLQEEVQNAAGRGEFLLYYQPQVRLADNALVGTEALLRWHHPRHGLLTPAAFLSALEAGPRAGTVGNWAINEVCRQAAGWRQAGHSLKVSVNLFSEQIRSGQLDTVVIAALRRWDLPGEAIELELTETIALRHDDAALRSLRTLRDLGVGLAFDDFGTGFASLATLARLPLTRLKIDRGLICDLSTDPHNRAIVEAALVTGRGLGLTIVAEGIETAKQEAFLDARGCHEGQGYRYGRPCPADEFTRRLLTQTARITL